MYLGSCGIPLVGWVDQRGAGRPRAAWMKAGRFSENRTAGRRTYPSPAPEVEVRCRRRSPDGRQAVSRKRTSGRQLRAGQLVPPRLPVVAGDQSASSSIVRWHSLQMLPSSKAGVVVARVIGSRSARPVAVVDEWRQQVVVGAGRALVPRGQGRLDRGDLGMKRRSTRPANRTPRATHGPGSRLGDEHV